MRVLKNIRLYVVSAIIAVSLSACATAPRPTAIEQPVAYTVRDTTTMLGRKAPVFLIENNDAGHNRIGTPEASADGSGKETVMVNPDRATFYTRQQVFTTPGGTYTNLIYRVHFVEVPGGWNPYYLTAGKNVGLLVVITLNQHHEPLLITTVHTCGCYLAFVPTSFLPADAWPAKWQPERQEVYGEDLPGILDITGGPLESVRPALVLRSGTHRVKDIRWTGSEAGAGERIVEAEILPLEALEQLDMENGTTISFYETSGDRRGYVKGSYKQRERLFMSWWALDWRVGEDKKLGLDKTDGIEFYTSLKPWARSASDMRDFAAFLDYWGWRF